MDDIEHFKKRVYYAQNREDLILRAFFPDLVNGTYVDIGAYDPDFESVTKFFYMNGWYGINVEPQQENYERFLKLRPKDINIHAGIASKKGTMLLRSYKNHGLSTFSANMKHQYEAQPDGATESYEDIMVEVTTLKQLLEAHNLPHINFMKVDVEGLEFEVLKSNDWQRYRPEVLCIEANHINQDWQNLLVSVDYELVFFDGLNDYYCDTRIDHKRNFDYVKSVVLEKGGGLRIDDFKVIMSLKKERDKLVQYAEHLLQEVAVRNERIVSLETQIQGHHKVLSSFRKSSRHAAGLLKKRMFKGLHE